MTIIVAVAGLLLLCFGGVLAFGPPYLPTLSRQVQTALDLAALRPGQTLLELGCGDGKILVAAAERGYKAIGLELNPLLVLLCWLRTRRYRRQVSVRWSNFLAASWPPADAVFIFGLARIMPQVDKKLVQSLQGKVKLVSFAFTIPGRSVLQERDGLYLYQYDPRLETKR